MSWSRDDFIAIVNSDIARKLFADDEISAYVQNWSDDHKAALLHANNIHAQSSLLEARQLLQLVAAFARKDLARMSVLLNEEHVSTGARLDYMLPLYDASYGSGEDIFVASVKTLLSGDLTADIHLPPERMIHKVGDNTGNPYTQEEQHGIEQYVNNSHLIRDLLSHAPNKTVIQPNPLAVDYILRNATTYRDTNNNPVIVFIPGIISLQDRSTSDLIQAAVDNGANINDVGFFGSTGIVWSIILGDVAAVNKFLALNARLDIEDEMRSEHVSSWIAATHLAAADDEDYCGRMALIMRACRRNNHYNGINHSHVFAHRREENESQEKENQSCFSNVF